MLKNHTACLTWFHLCSLFSKSCVKYTAPSSGRFILFPALHVSAMEVIWLNQCRLNFLFASKQHISFQGGFWCRTAFSRNFWLCISESHLQLQVCGWHETKYIPLLIAYGSWYQIYRDTQKSSINERQPHFNPNCIPMEPQSLHKSYMAQLRHHPLWVWCINCTICQILYEL